MNSQFLKDLIERAVKTAAQSLLAYFTAGAVDVVTADWGEALTIAGTATLISVLTSLLSLKLGNSGTASMTHAVVLADDPGKHAAPEA